MDAPPPDQPARAFLSPPAIGAAACAVLLGVAVSFEGARYSLPAIRWLTAAIAAILVGLFVPASLTRRPIVITVLPWILAACALEQAASVSLGLHAPKALRDWYAPATGLLGLLIILLPSAPARWVLFGLLLIETACLGAWTIRQSPDAALDVHQFQQEGSKALLHLRNPYEMRVTSIYADDTPYYGPGVVKDHRLTYGFPYPPVSLILAMPGYALFGDVRYAMLAALIVSALLMALARNDRLSMAGAVTLLLTPRVFYMIEGGWTEPLVLLTFSIAMLASIRRWRGLPLAIGLFLATKQYTVILIPAIFLLAVDAPGDCRGGNWRARDWRRGASLATKSILAAAAFTLPMAMWDFREFWRSVVQWQFVQPFRTDALSYAAWTVRYLHHPPPPTWLAFAVLPPAAALALWRCPRTRAGFAAAVTFVLVVFFAMNKQAFCNYYFLAIATGCWAIAGEVKIEKPAVAVEGTRSLQ